MDLNMARLDSDVHERDGIYTVTKTRPVRCGQANSILDERLKQWFRRCLGCVAGRREFLADRYFVVDVRQMSDVVVGWRHFISALDRREAVACLYVIADGIPGVRDIDPEQTGRSGVHGAVTNLAEIMSVLSDESPEALTSGESLNSVINTTCPVTGCRTLFNDFDAVAFVPQAADKADPLYDPLMSAPEPMVNISSDIYGFAMFTWDNCRSRFDCEIAQLTVRERRYLFAQASEAWQRIAEQTINNYARAVDQSLCPKGLSADKRSWIANHRDPAFAEAAKAPYMHDMPALYAPKIVQVWQQYFERGVWPRYDGVAAPGQAVSAKCPRSVGI